jgi:uncharacterized membrane protein YeaQ/YmgE (transglycosylase-associated protein family)
MQPFFIIPHVFVGTFVGTFAGALVGNFVGAWVGTLVGAWVGALVGALVGMFVGELVGVNGTSSRSQCWFCSSTDPRPWTSPLTPSATLAGTASARKVPSPFVRSVTNGSDGATFSSCARAGSTVSTENRENGGESLARRKAQGSGIAFTHGSLVQCWGLDLPDVRRRKIVARKGRGSMIIGRQRKNGRE